MTSKALDLVVPGRLATATGGYAYDRRILAGLAQRGWAVRAHELDTSFPYPSPAALAQAARVLAGIPRGRPVVIDGLALGGMPELVEQAAQRLRLIALIHHPLALETGIDATLAARLGVAERRALAVVRQVVATSPTTARELAGYGLPQERIAVVEPGTDPAPLARGSGGDDLALLCVATLTPRKGHALLVRALAAVRDLPWHLTCAGSTTRDRTTAGILAREIDALGLSGRIELTGELDEAALAERFQRADVFVMASHYEGYGMVFDEALARGLPIVATWGGATAETVPAAAGLLVPTGDQSALAAALRRLMTDAELRARLRAGARDARACLRPWLGAVAEFERVLARR